MCETLAFYHFDKWWQEQELKYKQKVINFLDRYNWIVFNNFLLIMFVCTKKFQRGLGILPAFHYGTYK